MTSVVAGLLLPDSVLTSPWFLLLATVVAFNTIVYVGLTFAKLIPWPRQFHPSWVRDKASRLGIKTSQEAIVQEIPAPEILTGDSPYDVLRQQVARRDIPQAFALTGGLVVVFAAVSALGFHDRQLWIHASELALGVAYLVTAVTLGQRRFGGRTMMWVWAVASFILFMSLIGEALALDNPFPLAYSLVVLTAYFPVTLAWRPALASGAAMLLGLTAVLLRLSGAEDLRLIVMAASCLLVGAVLLKLRLRALDALADERVRSDALASTDPLTGVLTRRGLLSLVPGVAATAERTGKQVCVIYTDVVHLQRANDDYGFGYGDEVLRVVAEVLRGTVRKGDLVGRWDGDEFLVTGLGDRPDPVAMRDRIEAAVKMTGVALGRKPIEVAVGTSAGDPEQDTFENLVHEARLDAVGSASGA